MSLCTLHGRIMCSKWLYETCGCPNGMHFMRIYSSSLVVLLSDFRFQYIYQPYFSFLSFLNLLCLFFIHLLVSVTWLRRKIQWEQWGEYLNNVVLTNQILAFCKLILTSMCKCNKIPTLNSLMQNLIHISKHDEYVNLSFYTWLVRVFCFGTNRQSQ